MTAPHLLFLCNDLICTVLRTDTPLAVVRASSSLLVSVISGTMPVTGGGGRGWWLLRGEGRGAVTGGGGCYRRRGHARLRLSAEYFCYDTVNIVYRCLLFVMVGCLVDLTSVKCNFDTARQPWITDS